MADFGMGKVPPHNEDAEKAVLGAILQNDRILEDVSSILQKDDFYRHSHQVLFESILKFRNTDIQHQVDLITITNFLTETGDLEKCGGVPYIASLTENVPTLTNVEYYAKIIKENSLRRQVLELASTMAEKSYDSSEKVQTLVDELEQKLSSINNSTGAATYFPAGKIISPAIDEIKNRIENGKTNGISTGYTVFDKYIGGFKKSEFIVIGARPSVGKTALSLSLAQNMAFRNKIKVGFFSLEMSGQALIERLFASEAKVNSIYIRDGKLNAEQYSSVFHAAEQMYDNSDNLYIQDTPNMKLLDIRAQARKMVRENGVQIIFIDYIGLIDADLGSNVPRHEQIARTSRSLKGLARELDIPVVCLSQVKRDASERPPILADLRESGSIEQDADLVVLLDDESKRLNEKNKVPEYSTEDGEVPPDFQDSQQFVKKIKIIIAKQRNGNTGAFNMAFHASYVRFETLQRGEDY